MATFAQQVQPQNDGAHDSNVDSGNQPRDDHRIEGYRGGLEQVGRQDEADG